MLLFMRGNFRWLAAGFLRTRFVFRAEMMRAKFDFTPVRKGGGALFQA